MTACCSKCGEEWARDPALEVICPTCNSQVGFFCGSKRPSGHKVRFGSALIHPARDQLAMEKGFLQPCPVATIPAITHADAGGLQMSFL